MGAEIFDVEINLDGVLILYATKVSSKKNKDTSTTLTFNGDVSTGANRIKNGKFTDVKRPTPFNPNQLKKIIKETFDEYVNHFSPKFSAEKEKVAFLNSLKADINKSQAEAICLEEECLEKLKALLEKKGVSEAQLLSYVSSAGLSLVKVNNCYYRKKAYTEFENYKKIEFRY